MFRLKVEWMGGEYWTSAFEKRFMQYVIEDYLSYGNKIIGMEDIS